MEILDKLADYQVQPVERIQQNAKGAKPNQTVFFGDSLIQGYNLARYFPNETFYNCGVNGATTSLLLYLHDYAIKPYHPSRVVLLIGTNDISSTHKYELLDVVYNVYKLIEIMNVRYNIKDIVLVSPLPIDEQLQSTEYKSNQKLNFLRKEYAKLAKEFDNVRFVDVFPYFMDDHQQLKNELTTDGLHLNDQGYDVLSEHLCNVL